MISDPWFLYRIYVDARTSKLHRRPIRNFDTKITRLIYTICSKNLTNTDFHEIFPANDGKFIRCKEAKNICKKVLVLGSKNTGTRKYPENFPNC